MFTGLKSWQLVLLVLVFPAVGVWVVWTDESIRLRFKIAALVYCAAAFLALLLLRRPAGGVVINAEPIS